jgi:glycerol-3-phosphate dehydrogenase
MTLSDFLMRRSSIGLRKDLGLDAITPVADEMQKLFGWSNEEKARQVQAQKDVISLGLKFRNP